MPRDVDQARTPATEIQFTQANRKIPFNILLLKIYSKTVFLHTLLRGGDGSGKRAEVLYDGYH